MNDEEKPRVTSGEAIDPRVVKFKAFVEVYDRWRAAPDRPGGTDDRDRLSETAIRVLRDEMLAATIGPIMADDPVTTAFRGLLPLALEWLQKRGQPGTHAAAQVLVERVFAALDLIGFAGAIQQVVYAAIRDARTDQDRDKLPEETLAEADAAGAAGLLRGAAALHELVTDHWLGSVGQLLSTDALGQSHGYDSLIGRKVRDRKRQNQLGPLLDDARGQSILRAHFEAGRDNCGWEKVHQQLFPDVAALDTRRGWNKRVDPKQRKLAHAAGLKAGQQAKLDDREQAIETLVLRCSAEDIAERLRRLAQE